MIGVDEVVQGGYGLGQVSEYYHWQVSEKMKDLTGYELIS